LISDQIEKMLPRWKTISAHWIDPNPQAGSLAINKIKRLDPIGKDQLEPKDPLMFIDIFINICDISDQDIYHEY
jgi:hypothetical protein